MKVLFVEDNRFDLEVFPELLALHLDLKWESQGVVDGIVFKIKKWNPDVILLDLTLEDSDSKNTIEIVLPAIVTLAPVVVLTGQEPEEVRRAIEKGAHAVVNKVSAVRNHSGLAETMKTAVLEFTERQKTQQSIDRASDSIDRILKFTGRPENA